MKFDRTSIGVGAAIGAAGTIFLAFLASTTVLESSPFCDRTETPLSCVRNWANVFAIFAGAAVVLVTLRGQKAEQQRHEAQLAEMRAPMRRAARLTGAFTAALSDALRDVATVEIAYAEVVGLNDDRRTLEAIGNLRRAISRVDAAMRMPEILDALDLIDFEDTRAFEGLKEHLREFWERTDRGFLGEETGEKSKRPDAARMERIYPRLVKDGVMRVHVAARELHDRIARFHQSYR